MDIEDFKHKTDPTRLHKLYVRKRQQFTGLLEEPQHETISSALSSAVHATDLCLSTHLSYQESIAQAIQESSTQYSNTLSSDEQRMEQIYKAHKETLATLADELDSDTHELLGASSQSNLDELETLHSIQELDSYLLSSRIDLACSMVCVNYATLCDMMTTRDSRVLYAILKVLVKATISLIPGGGVPVLLDDILMATDTRRKQVKHASDILMYLDDYWFSAYKWCVLTQMSADSLNAAPVDNPDYEDIFRGAAKAVEERSAKLRIATD